MYQIIPAFHKANTLSMLGLAFSVGSFYFISQGNNDGAMIALVLGGLCDLFDGKFAGMFERTYPHKQMGEFIDSFVDMVGSVALPVAFLLTFGLGHVASYVTAVFYATMGIHRLAYFHIVKEDGAASYFVGVPVTYIALAVPVWYTFCQVAGWGAGVVFRVGLHAVYLGLALAFVWERPITKPQGKMYAFFVLLALLVIALLLGR